MPGPISSGTIFCSQIEAVSDEVTSLESDTAEIIVNNPCLWGHGGDGNVTLDGVAPAIVVIGGNTGSAAGGASAASSGSAGSSTVIEVS